MISEVLASLLCEVITARVVLSVEPEQLNQSQVTNIQNCSKFEHCLEFRVYL